ncbi:MAG: hypothetical protein IJX38_02300 [Clostridia bacterium]|nr:hypothetical protein [Clostridia bacterium]MBQ8371760.1 hypothetical protein [Clostridia bacterium]
MIRIMIAGLSVGIDNRYGYIERMAQDYLTDRPAVFTVRADEEEIRREGEQTPEQRYPDGYLESIVVYRKIAERLPEFDAFVFHGAVLNMDGVAYAFTARSGVGKTTHTRLWHTAFGDRVHYLNGDKPIIRFIDGVPYACGTPWKGKEGYGTNEMAPLEGIAFLKRGEHNEAYEVGEDKIVTFLMGQIYIPKRADGAMRVMRLANRLVGSVRLVELKCNMDVEAAYVSHAAMSKKD